jgi:hypothetical protein
MRSVKVVCTNYGCTMHALHFGVVQVALAHVEYRCIKKTGACTGFKKEQKG